MLSFISHIPTVRVPQQGPAEGPWGGDFSKRDSDPASLSLNSGSVSSFGSSLKDLKRPARALIVDKGTPRRFPSLHPRDGQLSNGDALKCMSVPRGENTSFFSSKFEILDAPGRCPVLVSDQGSTASSSVVSTPEGSPPLTPLPELNPDCDTTLSFATEKTLPSSNHSRRSRIDPERQVIPSMIIEHAIRSGIIRPNLRYSVPKVESRRAEATLPTVKETPSSDRVPVDLALTVKSGTIQRGGAIKRSARTRPANLRAPKVSSDGPLADATVAVVASASNSCSLSNPAHSDEPIPKFIEELGGSADVQGTVRERPTRPYVPNPASRSAGVFAYSFGFAGVLSSHGQVKRSERYKPTLDTVVETPEETAKDATILPSGIRLISNGSRFIEHLDDEDMSSGTTEPMMVSKVHPMHDGFEHSIERSAEEGKVGLSTSSTAIPLSSSGGPHFWSTLRESILGMFTSSDASDGMMTSRSSGSFGCRDRNNHLNKELDHDGIVAIVVTPPCDDDAFDA